MDDTQRLLNLEELKGLKARYFRFVDTKAWDDLVALFSPEPVFDISDDQPGCVLTSREAIREAVSTPLSHCVSVHHGHCPEITLTSDSTAEGIWAMEDMLRWEEGSGSPIKTLHGYGHYHETYERVDGRWHIKTMKLKRLRVDITR